MHDKPACCYLWIMQELHSCKALCLFAMLLAYLLLHCCHHPLELCLLFLLATDCALQTMPTACTTVHRSSDTALLMNASGTCYCMHVYWTPQGLLMQAPGSSVLLAIMMYVHVQHHKIQHCKAQQERLPLPSSELCGSLPCWAALLSLHPRHLSQ